MNLKDTLNLPKTAFPMRGNLVKREPERIAHWQKLGLYEASVNQRKGGPSFILHDGPPFTNGDVHLGTALNKILKDTILGFKRMQGYYAPYVPGWDCHGLPIEHKVALQLRQEGKELPASELRESCAAFSSRYIETQQAQFERLGVLADWAGAYRTMAAPYEATILRTFAAFVEQGLVYRSKKPVYWSIPCETALAEAEVEYKDHKSPSIWVAFPLQPDSLTSVGLPKGTAIVIWTTTPWTLPANQAVAVHPRYAYVVVRDCASGNHYVVAEPLLEDFQEKTGLQTEVARRLCGAELAGLSTLHPFINRESPIIEADYVTMDSGTGCVHIAPGHGTEDYLSGLRHGLPVYCPLDDAGCYIADEWMPPSLVGVTVLETDGWCPANGAVLKLLDTAGCLLAKKTYLHQYPHCWRSKTPVIFRAMDQWFVGLDKVQTRQRVLEAIEQVSWVPDWGIKRIRAAVENRPDWCVSRQRSWGVPLPVFFDAHKKPLLDAGVIRALAEKIETAGTQAWFTQSAQQLLEGIDLPEGFDADTLGKGTDTLDVWLDSGCSHRAVLQQHEALKWPADLYLEGSDQHRGWFQSSIWTGVIAEQGAPFKEVLTHGFIVEASGEKISKSKGAMSSDGWVGKYGADIVRLWVASQDFRGDIRLSEDHFKRVQGTYRTIRNTLMYQLGNLCDFDPLSDSVEHASMHPIDRWALSQTARYLSEVTSAYERYEFHQVYKLIERFTGVTLSRYYHDILKDRLYTSGKTWQVRRSSQAAIQAIFDVLVRTLAPILTFTADEAWSYATARSEFTDKPVHLQDWPIVPEAWSEAKEGADLDALLGFRDRIYESLESLRARKEIGRFLDAEIRITPAASDPLAPLFEQYGEHLAELFIVSKVEVLPTSSLTEATTFTARHASGVQCPRSWRWVPELVDAGDFGAVSPRDREALLNP